MDSSCINHLGKIIICHSMTFNYNVMTDLHTWREKLLYMSFKICMNTFKLQKRLLGKNAEVAPQNFLSPSVVRSFFKSLLYYHSIISR